MENNERDRKLDQWLDEALSQYSAAEPRLGLEQRVLAHVAAEEKTRSSRRGWWRWMPAFAAIAAVLIVMVAVRPYWEQKDSGVSSYVQSQKTAAEKPQAMDELQPKRPAAADKAAKVPMRAAIMEAPAAPATKVAADKDVAAHELRDRNAALESKSTLPPRPPGTFGSPQGAAKKELDTNFSHAEAAPQPVIMPMNVPAATPATAQEGILGGVVSGTVTNGAVQDRRSAAANASPLQAQTIPVNTPAAVQVPSGVVATEKIAAMPPVSAKQLRTMKGKAAGPLAKTLEQKVDTVPLVGMPLLRTDLKTIPLGPHQFPTPTPLSEQEKLMLSAAKNMKNKPATEEKQDTNDGQSKDIEIKKIEIAPLPGPQK